MYTTGFNDSILHFLGYLHIAEDLTSIDRLYEGASFRTITLELTAYPPPPGKPNLDVEDMGSRPMRLAPDGVPIEEALHLRHLSPELNEQEFDSVGGFLPRLSPNVAIPQVVWNIGPMPVAPRKINVEYTEGGMQTLLSVRQVNRQLDNDVATADEIAIWNGDSWSSTFGEIDPTPVLKDMVAKAQSYTRNDLDLAPSADTPEIIAFFDARDQAWKDGKLPEDEAVEAGRYVDGVKSDAEPSEALEAPTIKGIENAEWVTSEDGTVSRTITGPSDGIGTAAQTGGNEATNAIIIKDLAGLNGSMIVNGDAFHSNVIVQVNILVDNDKVDLVLGAGSDPWLDQILRSAEGGGNAVHNIAEFVHHDYSNVVRGAAFTPEWKVDVVDGDFFSIRALTQTNLLFENDRISQFSDDTFYQLRTGDNRQINLADLYNANDYDVIIVGGSYHSGNWIFQKNIVIDDDWLTSRLDGGEGSSQTAFAGGNRLINEAKITNHGSDEYREMNDAQRSLVQSLQNGETTLTPNPEWQMNGSASGTLKVLFINGDFYDLNLVSQTNVLADLDQLAQWTADNEALQAAITGANSVYNYAHIVDAGTMSGSSFVGGESYEDSILIQASIVTDEDQIAVQTEGYAPELIAFVEHGSAPTDPSLCSAPAKICDPALYDNPGNVLN